MSTLSHQIQKNKGFGSVSQKPKKSFEEDPCIENAPLRSYQDVSIMAKVRSKTTVVLHDVEVTGTCVCDETPQHGINVKKL
ncbi:unnamed protein product [Oikopleura dioica]|uniref:Uncharacterized protein n=1 Tax=Oikopleura dioica TaxID=34765 RepID=E4XEL4_OIKDI|nr:unnamed protein product [Oikopleura dioica]CBY31123.1 unnamed protein product [Oikopleura dioica]